MTQRGTAAFACLLAAALAPSAPAGPATRPHLPDRLAAAPPNTWIKITAEGTGGRSSPGLVWVPRERRFVCFGGSMGMLAKHRSPYSELTLNLAERRWENRFPAGKPGVWGERVGPSRAPRFEGSYYAVRMKDTEGNVRPYLGSGYDRAMFLYDNYAWDSRRGVVVLAWHHGGITAEYEPVGRTWHVIDAARAAPEGFWDNFLWGAMCYDPVNREVLGGRGRWAYSARAGRWRRLEFRNRRLDELRAAAEKLQRQLKDLVGASRSRYFLSETAEEAKTALDELAAGIERDAAALADRLADAFEGASGHDKVLIAWAREELKTARAALARAAALLRKKVQREAIHEAEDARDAMESCALRLAVQPPPRAFSPMVYDAANRKIVMFGGDRLDRRLADTWVYDCASRTWQQRRPKRCPPPRAGHGLAYLPKSREVLLVDGYGIGKVGRSWVYDTAANEWSLLAEGAGKRPVLTARPHYRFMPGPLAANDDDLVVMISRREEFRGRAKISGTWAAKIDASRIDAAGTARLGVAPGTMSPVRGPLNPRWYERGSPVPRAGADKRLDGIAPNTWVRLAPANNPKLNRAWGTTVLDPARDQIIQWGGGHAAYSGNDVLHYNIRTDRCSTGSFCPEFALNWNASMLFPPMPTTFARRPWAQHTYHNYAVDPASNRMIAYSRSAGRFFVYDPWTRDWKGTFGRRFARQGEKRWASVYYNTTCVPTPDGLTVWTPVFGLLRLDAKALKWKELPLSGKLPGTSPDNQGAACDRRRDRLLLFAKELGGRITTYDRKTGRIGLLTPAGADRVQYRPRETVYVAHADGVLVGACPTLSDGRAYWLFYDCAKNAWLGVRPAGEGPKAGFGLGLMCDAKRKLVWAAGSRLELFVLRLDLKRAAVRPLADEPPAGKSAPRGKGR